MLVRAGHTGSLRRSRAAWPACYPAGVICEIMNDDGTMARMPDLVAFAQRHGLKIGTIEDLIGYRLRHDRIVRQVAKTAVDSAVRRHLRSATSTKRPSSPSSIWLSSKAILAPPVPCWCACMR